MDEVWVPLFSALLGGVIASIASITSIILQSRFQAKRERGRLVMEAAIQEHKIYVDLAKVTSGPRRIYPLSTFLISNAGLLKLVEEDALTPENLRKHHLKMGEIMKVIEENPEEHQQKTSPGNTEQPG